MGNKMSEIEHLNKALELTMHSALDMGRVFNKDIILNIVNKRLGEEEEPTPIKAISYMHAIIDYYYNLLHSSSRILTVYIPDIIGLGMALEEEGLDNNMYDSGTDFIIELYTRLTLEHSLTSLQGIGDDRAAYILKEYTPEQLDELNVFMSPGLDYFLDLEVVEEYARKRQSYFEHEAGFVLFQHELLIDVIMENKGKSIAELRDIFIEKLKSCVSVDLTDLNLEEGYVKE